jgi:hypothetical protein
MCLATAPHSAQTENREADAFSSFRHRMEISLTDTPFAVREKPRTTMDRSRSRHHAINACTGRNWRLIASISFDEVQRKDPTTEPQPTQTCFNFQNSPIILHPVGLYLSHPSIHTIPLPPRSLLLVVVFLLLNMSSAAMKSAVVTGTILPIIVFG